MHPRDWIEIRPEGAYCRPGDFYIDPLRAVPTAVITHGHSDHARAGHGRVWATAETLAIMTVRLGADAGASEQTPLAYGETIEIGDVRVSLHPAGHVLGSAQVRLEYRGKVIVFSGDYKRRPDPTCTPFELVPCDVFVTEATFALPVFRHPPIAGEIGRLLTSVQRFPERCHLVGVYALGKCQRVMAELRAAGYGDPIFLHGAMIRLTELYAEFGVELGPWQVVTPENAGSLAGKIVLAPPGALNDRWSRRLPEVLTVAASGWMRIRARARQKGVELPLVISDHCDWDELVSTIGEVGASDIWVTHGRDDALVHQATTLGLRAQALHLIGYEEEAE